VVCGIVDPVDGASLIRIPHGPQEEGDRPAIVAGDFPCECRVDR
jgi:hypothetical protein